MGRQRVDTGFMLRVAHFKAILFWACAVTKVFKIFATLKLPNQTYLKSTHTLALTNNLFFLLIYWLDLIAHHRYKRLHFQHRSFMSFWFNSWLSNFLNGEFQLQRDFGIWFCIFREFSPTLLPKHKQGTKKAPSTILDMSDFATKKN